MKYDLNWDVYNNNGVIQNDLYPHGVLFEGSEKKPDLGFNYDWFMYYESQEHYVIHKDGILQNMTMAERSQIQQIAINWVQAEGDEGNPTLQQMKDYKASEMLGILSGALAAEYQTGDGFAITTDEVMLQHLQALDLSNKAGTVYGTDGILHSTTKNDAARYHREVLQAHTATRDHYYEKIAAINACTTKACVEAIEW